MTLDGLALCCTLFLCHAKFINICLSQARKKKGCIRLTLCYKNLTIPNMSLLIFYMTFDWSNDYGDLIHSKLIIRISWITMVTEIC